MSDCLTKTSIINLKEFIVINYLSWESDLSTRPPKFFEYCLEVSMNTSQWERLSWKTVYSMNLANNNTKWVSSQLLSLSVYLPVGHMDPLLTLYSLLCVTKWQRNGWDLWRTCKRRTVILKQRRRLDVVFTLSKLKSESVSSRTFPFWFGM